MQASSDFYPTKKNKRNKNRNLPALYLSLKEKLKNAYN
jgi:hypothetical protein